MYFLFIYYTFNFFNISKVGYFNRVEDLDIYEYFEKSINILLVKIF